MKVTAGSDQFSSFLKPSTDAPKKGPTSLMKRGADYTLTDYRYTYNNGIGAIAADSDKSFKL